MARKTARQAAERIIDRLSNAGYQALLAGGCVRDLLLGNEPKDYDVATDATPEEICEIYPRAQKVGAHFGVVIVRQFGHQIEVATFRADCEYKDGRHPEAVIFTTAEKDAQRRDFTINGMFYDPGKDEVIDYVGGREDLNNKTIRAIGDPRRRFEEDHLRMLRAVRFASRLGFDIQQATFGAIRRQAGKIRSISAERIREELEQILIDAHRAEGFELLQLTGLLPHLWPESSWDGECLRMSKNALATLPQQSSLALAFATMLYHQDPRTVDRTCRNLMFSNKSRKEIAWLIDSLISVTTDRIRTLADLKLLMAGPCFDELLHLHKAYLLVEAQPLSRFESLRDRARAVPADQIAPPPFVSGDDLHEMGLQQGPQFKHILHEIYYRQLNLELADRNTALREAHKLVRQSKC